MRIQFLTLIVPEDWLAPVTAIHDMVDKHGRLVVAQARAFKHHVREERREEKSVAEKALHGRSGPGGSSRTTRAGSSICAEPPAPAWRKAATDECLRK